MSDAGRAPDTANWNPVFAQRLAAFRDALTKAGINSSIASGYRSPEYQNQMYQNHLAKQAKQPLPYPNVEAPNVVAPAWRSFHNYGIAADLHLDNPNDYARMAEMARQFGLSGIGSSDPGHIQLAGTLADDIKQYNLAGWRPDNRPAPETGAIAYTGGPPAGQPPPNLVARGAAPAGSPAAEHEAFIRDYAAKIGVNPELAVGIARAEGMNSTGFRSANQASTVDVSGGQPFSFGDFQLNTKGGMGVDALKAGIDPRDPKQWQAADQFALDQMKASGIAPWSDPFARSWTASGKPITGSTTLTSTPTGIVDPSIVAHGGTSPPLPDASGATTSAPAATPSFGDAARAGDVGGALKAALTKPPPTKDAQGNTVEGKSPADKLADAIAPAGRQPAPIPEMQGPAPVQDPDPGLAPAAQQLFSTVSQSAARPLSWTSAPYGANAGLVRPGGTTLNQTGYGYG